MTACEKACHAQGHFHLSHNYTRSISVAGNCAFVQTGVIGDCNRDGFRHSRVIKGNYSTAMLTPVTLLGVCSGARTSVVLKWCVDQWPAGSRSWELLRA